MKTIPKTKKDKSLFWKVNTPQLLQEIATNNTVAILKIPLNIFQSILLEVANRALELNDPKLNALMLRLALYDNERSDEKKAKQIQKYIEKHS